MALTLPSPFSVRTAVDKPKAHNKPLDEFPRSMTCRPPHRQSSCGQLKAKSSSQSHPHEATFEWAADQRPERLHRLQDGGHNGSATTRVPVYVMLPLDTVSPNGGGLTRTRALNASLMALRSAGVEGVMVDVWWGLVEKDGPLRYNWGSYNELVKMVARHGLKLQMVMSFHQCGGNVGDSCSIPLPPWVQEEMSRDPDIVYRDRSGRRNPEYISLGCDMLPVLRGRTPIQVYTDYMRSFRDHFQEYLGDVIPIAQTLAKHGVVLNFTCMEMKDERQPGHANCSPVLLVTQVKEATKVVGVELARENALGIYNDSAYSQILTTSRSDAGSGLSAFTYLRMKKNMFEGENWRQFVAFVKSMNEGGRRVMPSKSDSSHSDLYVGFITNKNQNMKTFTCYVFEE